MWQYQSVNPSSPFHTFSSTSPGGREPIMESEDEREDAIEIKEFKKEKSYKMRDERDFVQTRMMAKAKEEIIK